MPALSPGKGGKPGGQGACHVAPGARYRRYAASRRNCIEHRAIRCRVLQGRVPITPFTAVIGNNPCPRFLSGRVFPGSGARPLQGSQYSLPGPEATAALSRLSTVHGSSDGVSWGTSLGSGRGVSVSACGCSSDSALFNRTGSVSWFESALCCIASPFLSCSGASDSGFYLSRGSVKRRQL
jgi:hypothetical protein